MKGISPLIAAVLLIAFTVAVGGIISIWLTTFAKTTTGNVEASTTDITKCASTYLSLDKVFVSQNRLIISNMGTASINLTNFTMSDGTIGYLGGFIPGGSAVSKTVYIGSNTSVTVKGLCLGSVPVEASCSSDQPCWVS
mgnify:CR=1 FL=1